MRDPFSSSDVENNNESNHKESKLSPTFLHFPLDILEEAFGNCEVKLTRCDNDPGLSEQNLRKLKGPLNGRIYLAGEMDDHVFKRTSPPALVKRRIMGGDKVTAISLKNCPSSEFKVILVHDRKVQEGWVKEGVELVYYANLSDKVEVDGKGGKGNSHIQEPEPDDFDESQCVFKFKRSNNKFICGYCKAKFTRRDSVKKHQIRACLSNETSRASRRNRQDTFKCDPPPPILSKAIVVEDSVEMENDLKPVLDEDGNVIDIIDPELPKQIIRNTHLPRDHRCTYCDNSYTRRTHLMEHVITVHHGIKRFKCPLCDRRFSRRWHIKGHMVSVHTKERPHKCKLCNKRFATTSNLNWHLNTHLADRPKPHLCTICGKRFARRYDLKNHKQQHLTVRPRPYRCTVCGKGFTRSYHLTLHSQLHMEKRPTPHKCNVCGRGFSRPYGLKIHLLTHKDKQFQCPFCSLKLRKEATLDYHIQRYHPHEKVNKKPKDVPRRSEETEELDFEALLELS